MTKAQIVVFEQLPVLTIHSKSEDGYLVQNATWTDKSKLRAAVGRPSAASNYGHPVVAETEPTLSAVDEVRASCFPSSRPCRGALPTMMLGALSSE